MAISIPDFAKSLRIPTVIVRPASLRIYRNSTVRYATQYVFSPFSLFSVNLLIVYGHLLR